MMSGTESMQITVKVQMADGRKVEKECYVIGRTGQTFTDRGEELVKDALIEALAPEEWE